MPIFPFIGLAKQSKALEAGLQLLSMVGQWWAQSQAAACILSQVLSNLRAVSQKPVMFRPVSDEWYGATSTRFVDTGNGFGEQLLQTVLRLYSAKPHIKAFSCEVKDSPRWVAR